VFVRAQLSQDAPEVRLRSAISIAWSGIEVSDAGLEGGRDGFALLCVATADHQSADSSAAEAERRDTESGSTEVAALDHLRRNITFRVLQGRDAEPKRHIVYGEYQPETTF
jgi:hypothetical protein